MQGYGKQLTLKEIAAVVTSERNAWGNNTGDAVQAADVNSAMSASSSATEQVTETIQTLKEDIVETVTEDLSKTYEKEELMAMGETVYLASDQ